jgi:hypothetical protein
MSLKVISVVSTVITLAVGTFAAAVVTSSPAAAQPRVARCELTIDGRTYIRGACDFQAIARDGSFQITDHEDQPYFAQVLVERPGVAAGYWNGQRTGQKAHYNLGTLIRKGACWANKRAKVCAY